MHQGSGFGIFVPPLSLGCSTSPSENGSSGGGEVLTDFAYNVKVAGSGSVRPKPVVPPLPFGQQSYSPPPREPPARSTISSTECPPWMPRSVRPAAIPTPVTPRRTGQVVALHFEDIVGSEVGRGVADFSEGFCLIDGIPRMGVCLVPEHLFRPGGGPPFDPWPSQDPGLQARGGGIK